MSASHAAADDDDGAGFSYDFKIKEFITLEKKKSLVFMRIFSLHFKSCRAKLHGGKRERESKSMRQVEASE